MSKIYHLNGDATRPQGDGIKIIPHICNDIGAWGAGFVIALSNRWREPEMSYRNMNKHLLGDVRFVQVEPNTIVANMIAQHDIRPDKEGNPPVRYNALKQCLIQVNREAIKLNATVHCPKFGAGLAGGDWNTIEEIIKSTMSVDTYVYIF